MKKILRYFGTAAFAWCFAPCFLIAQAQEANLLGRWDDPDLPGSSFYNNTYNEVWGVAVNGHEYAVLGSTLGTHFIDVTNPAQPFERFFIAGKAQGTSIIHRDYKTYKNYLYAVCDEGSSSLQIMDISGLPDTLTVVYDKADLIRRAHNVFVDTVKGTLYALATSSQALGFSGMAVFDLTDPANPTFINKYNAIGNFSFGHVHDAYINDGIAYLNCGFDGMCVADFNDPAQPQLLGTLTNYQNAGYNHSGWLSADGRYLFMTDENHGSPVKTIDVQDFSDLKVVDTYTAESVPSQIPHNPLVACDYLYVAYYYDGLQVYDVSDPQDVKRVLYFDTSAEPDGTSYKGAWGVYPFLPSGNILVSDMQNGLYVFEGVNDGCLGGMSPVRYGQEARQIRAYPQPASSVLHFALESAGSAGRPLQVWLFDASGRCVLQQAGLPEEGVFSMDIPASVPDGLYFVTVMYEKNNFFHKALISRK